MFQKVLNRPLSKEISLNEVLKQINTNSRCGSVYYSNVPQDKLIPQFIGKIHLEMLPCSDTLLLNTTLYSEENQAEQMV